MEMLGLRTDVSLVVGLWNDDLDTMWRSAVRTSITESTPWCLCTNGHQIRLVDSARTYSRAHLQFNLDKTLDDARTFSVFWALMRGESFRPTMDEAPLITRVIAMSAHHGAAVSRALRFGVIDAVGLLLSGLVRSHEEALAAGFDESLTLVYRVLFLMFAEARGLVPTWHPVYRDHYTIEALRDQVDDPSRARGLWDTLQAIARLAHTGCRAGTLVVPAFNGRLFSPAHSPMAARCAMSDDTTRHALLALSTAPSANKRARIRIDYRDLGVEQLGAVYESVLDYEPAFLATPSRGLPRVQLRRGGDRRKASGSFYTPQSITDYLVRRTLHPLVDGASASQILRLRVLDPSMGSAAFLVSACHFLARAYEEALIREGQCHSRVDDAQRAGFRREVAQHCLYGVDLNPTAVQLARLSLWLATLAAGKPLTFLDHHLIAGDSLLGASLMDIARRPPNGVSGSSGRPGAAPLFEERDMEPSLATLVGERRWIADTPDDRLEVVRKKERLLERLGRSHPWTSLADLWCACWMWPDSASTPDAAVFGALSDAVVRGRSALPQGIVDRLLATARGVAVRRKFFHWMLEFPEVYFGSTGEPDPNPGFDAVIGNPPWDMLRADSGDARPAARRDNALIKRFIRHAGIYRFQGGGHVNRYQLFLERAMGLVKAGGRLGLVLPSGIMTDHTSAPLRRRLLEHHGLDSLIGFDNRRGIFPIHRSVRFVLCTATAGARTSEIRCRFGIDDPQALDALPDAGQHRGSYPITLTPALISRLGGARCTIPDLRTALDLRIVERIANEFPRLSDPDGWGAKFGRELNATDDRRHFHKSGDGDGLPVLEGKHVEPFLVHPGRSALRVTRERAERLLGPTGAFLRPRLAYRDVASATNRTSLISAVLPAGVVTTHSIFCLKTPLSVAEQRYLCGILNSYVANYLVRQVLTTHLGSTTVEDLRAPKPDERSPLFTAISVLSGELSQGASARGARLQALAAQSFKLSEEEFRHVLGTFPLVPELERNAALDEFSRSGRG
jgi:N-6 DNA Methylase/Eco57I restriction-modification methylase